MVVFMPLLLALAVIFGMFLGRNLNLKATGGPSQSIFNPKNKSSEKIEEVLSLIKDEYVDTVNMDKLTESAIVAVLEQLDPHSSYIPPVNLQAYNEDLEGNFEGIGVEFNLVKDTIVVVSAISGGPSEAVGIRAGDRIVNIDGENVAGKNFTNEDVIKRLRGKKGTKVDVKVSRKGVNELLPFTIKRDKIPLYSVDASYLVQPDIGYIKINRFAESTYDEFMDAMHKLKDEGMKKLILDLRGNPGGYLNSATDIADEFLSNKKMIVYTEGKARKRRNYYATANGDFEKQPLVVLVDEGSASASEIVSGAVQDNDRGTIIGRRTFGKGLVQEQIEFKDGSAIRLTVARYYTATGRCIQRSYAEGVEKYYEALYQSMLGNETDNDSLYHDSLQMFKTAGGKVVYGGGGIMPDIYVPHDTSSYSAYLSDVISKGYTYDFCFDYADHHRDELKKRYKSYRRFAEDQSLNSQLVQQFVKFAAEKGAVATDDELKKSSRYLAFRIKAIIARNLWNNDAFYFIQNQDDEVFTKALDFIKKQ